MTIEKLPSGSYRIKQMVDGKTYRFTLDHKPTKIEAMRLLSEITLREPTGDNMTVESACKAYIDAKKNVVSPSTIRTYYTHIRAISDVFKGIRLNALTSEAYQREINRFSVGHAPKTVKNQVGFLSSVFLFHDIKIKTPRRPQDIVKEMYIPTKEEVRKIIKYYAGSEHEVFFRFSMYGLRRSETLALKMEDIDFKKLTVRIDKALVLGSNKQWVVKPPKTPESTRTIVIDKELAELIKQQGYVWKGNPSTPLERLEAAQKALNLPHFTLHSFRHFAASYWHDLGYSDQQIMDVMGWKTDYVMKKRYRHSLDLEQAKHNMSNDVLKLLE